MQGIHFPTTARELGGYLGASVLGDGAAFIEGLAPIEGAGPGKLTFLAQRRFAGALQNAEGAVVLTRPDLVQEGCRVTYLLVDHPQAAFARLADLFSLPFTVEGVSAKADIHPKAVLSSGVRVGAFAVIAQGAVVGEGSSIGPYTYVGREVRVGRNCVIHARVTLLERVTVGDRVTIFPGSVIGSEGFGFFDVDGARVRMPQIGTVVIEDDVRIGANCTIDRATFGDTRIGRGTKIDNLVHVGHNVQVGAHCVLCAGVGLSGSAVLEDEVMLGGQAGVAPGVRIGKGARLGGQCGTSANLVGNESYLLTPAIRMSEALKIIRYWRRLPEIWQRLRQLETLIGIDSRKPTG